MEATEFLGLDLGLKHTGIARGSALVKIAQPLPGLPTETLLTSLMPIIDQNKTDAIVVGLPRNLRGEDSTQTAWVRQWVTRAKDKIQLPFYWQDEALTSIQSRSNPFDRFDKLTASELRASKQKVKSMKDEHSLAAALILQDFLDESEAARVPA